MKSCRRYNYGGLPDSSYPDRRLRKMRIPRFRNWQAVALCLGLYVLLPFSGNLAHGIEGFDGFILMDSAVNV